MTAPADLTPSAMGHTNYERHRRRMLAYGRWHPHADAEPVREHLRWLREHGVGRVTAAKLAGVGESTVTRIRAGRRVISAETARRILAVTEPLSVLVDAVGSRRRLQALGAIGWDQKYLAGRIGWRVQNLNLIVHGKRGQVTRETDALIRRLYDELSTTPAPDGYPSARARGSARKHGWVSPLAWDDDTIDDPNAVPDVGAPDDRPDEVAVVEFLAGRLPADQLSDADQLEVYRRMTAEGASQWKVRQVLGASKGRMKTIAATA